MCKLQMGLSENKCIDQWLKELMYIYYNDVLDYHYFRGSSILYLGHYIYLTSVYQQNRQKQLNYVAYLIAIEAHKSRTAEQINKILSQQH